MDHLERLAGQLAHDVDRLIGPSSEEELLETATLVTKLTEEFAAFQRGEGELPAPPPHHTAVILIVEPEAEDRAALRRLLEELGHIVLEASDGAGALELSEGYPGAIRAMLTNVIMPDMSGREAAERMALLRPDLAVVYLSGYTDEEIMFYGVLGPGVAVLQKPISSAALAARLAEALEPQYV